MSRRPPVVLVQIAGPYRAQHEMLMGVIGAATGAHGWTIANCWAEVRSAADLRQAIGWYGADAAIMLGGTLAGLGDWLVASGLPAVLLRHRDPRLPCALVDEAEVAAAACDHLVATGVPHLALLPHDALDSGRQRQAGFIARAARSGRRVIAAPGCIEGHDNPALDAWLAALPRPCGVFCSNDHAAAEALRACQRAGLVVPRELLILGVDDEPALCHQGHPPLSSVAIPWQELGRLAVRLLAGRLRRPAAAPATAFVRPTGVTVRASTDLLAVEDGLVRRAVGLIRDRSGRDIGIKELVRELGCSRTVLETRFRAALGCSPFTEIRRTRLAVARRLLARGDLGIGEVARGAGFSSPAALRRARRTLG